MPRATPIHLASNDYEVTIKGVGMWFRMKDYDGHKMRVDGRESVQVQFAIWPTRTGSPEPVH
jgi:hypothetical protein